MLSTDLEAEEQKGSAGHEDLDMPIINLKRSYNRKKVDRSKVRRSIRLQLNVKN